MTFSQSIHSIWLLFIVRLETEAVVSGCSVKKVFLENSQNLRENTCPRFFSNKVAGVRLATLLKKGRWPRACSFILKSFWHRSFPLNFANFLRKLFYRTPPVAASVERYFWFSSNAFMEFPSNVLQLTYIKLNNVDWKYWDYS